MSWRKAFAALSWAQALVQPEANTPQPSAKHACGFTQRLRILANKSETVRDLKLFNWGCVFPSQAVAHWGSPPQDLLFLPPHLGVPTSPTKDEKLVAL